MCQPALRRGRVPGPTSYLNLSNQAQLRMFMAAVHMTAIGGVAFMTTRYSWTDLLSPWVVFWLALLLAANYRAIVICRDEQPNSISAGFTIECAVMALFNPLVATLLIAVGTLDEKDLIRKRGLLCTLMNRSMQAACAALGVSTFGAVFGLTPASRADVRIVAAMAASGVLLYITSTACDRAHVAIRNREGFWENSPFKGNLTSVYVAQMGLAMMLVLIVEQDQLLGVLMIVPLWYVRNALAHLGPNPRSAHGQTRPDSASVHLTSREMQILSFIARGKANKQIALEQGISIHTVQRHVANVYEKAGIQGRAEATLLALRLGLLDGTVQDTGFTTTAQERRTPRFNLFLQGAKAWEAQRRK